MIELIFKFIMNSAIGIVSGLIAGLYALKIMRLNKNKNEDIIIYWMFSLVVSIAFIHIMKIVVY